ncbi:EAL domain-containing protein [Desulfurobacterium sp.]
MEKGLFSVWEKLKKPVLILKNDGEIAYCNSALKSLFNKNQLKKAKHCYNLIFGSNHSCFEEKRLIYPVKLLMKEHRDSCTVLRTIKVHDKDRDYLIECFRENGFIVEIFTEVTEIIKEFGREKIKSIKEFASSLIGEVAKSDRTFITLISISNFDEIVKIYGIETAIIISGRLESKIKKFLSIFGAESFAISDGNIVTVFKNGFAKEEIRKIEKKILNMLTDFEIEMLEDKIPISTILISVFLKKEEFSTVSDLISVLLLMKNRLSFTNEKKVALNSISGIEKIIIKKRQKLKLIVKSLHENKIDIFFQPIVNLLSGKLEHFEALMRVRDGGKIIPAGYFVNELYENNLSVECDLKVLDKLREYREILGKFRYPVYINVSHRALGSALYRNELRKTINLLAESNVKVNIEITEQVLFENFKILEMASREFNFLIAIDDFGSGYSSFKLVSELVKRGMVSAIKIDGSLVKNIAYDENLSRIVSLISFMAKVFRLKTIAEYVENREIVKILEELNIDNGQGYFFSKPVPIDKIEDIVNKFGGSCPPDR